MFYNKIKNKYIFMNLVLKVDDWDLIFLIYVKINQKLFGIGKKIYYYCQMMWVKRFCKCNQVMLIIGILILNLNLFRILIIMMNYLKFKKNKNQIIKLL